MSTAWDGTLRDFYTSGTTTDTYSWTYVDYTQGAPWRSYSEIGREGQYKEEDIDKNEPISLADLRYMLGKMIKFDEALEKGFILASLEVVVKRYPELEREHWNPKKRDIRLVQELPDSGRINPRVGDVFKIPERRMHGWFPENLKGEYLRVDSRFKELFRIAGREELYYSKHQTYGCGAEFVVLTGPHAGRIVRIINRKKLSWIGSVKNEGFLLI